MIDPGLNTDLSVGGICLCETVIDICTQSLKRDGTLAVSLLTRHICAAQTSGNGSLDSKCAGLHGSAHAGLHGAAESDTVFQLLSDILSYQLCIQIRLLDLLDINEKLLLGKLLNLSPYLLDLCTALTDNDTGLCCIYSNLDLITGSLDVDLGNVGILQTLLQIFTNIIVFNKVIGELLILGICIPL